MNLAEELPALLQVWLPGQRWFGGKDRPVDGVRVLQDVVLPSAPGFDGAEVHHVVVAVEQAGTTGTYQVPVSLRWGYPDRLEHVHLGGTSDGQQVYDALHDKVGTAALLTAFGGAGQVGPLRFVAEADAELPYVQSSIVLSGEQSNTSVVYGDVAILKVFRRLAPGPNPDIEVHDALTRAGSTQVAALLGWIEGTWPGPGGEEVAGSLAMLQRYLVTATDGWALASASVRDLFAEADLHADEVGGDFAAEAGRLGATTAEVHGLMRETLDSGVREPAGTLALARAMHRRLDAALAVVPGLAAHSAGLRAAYDALEDLAEPVPVQRIHGDYHLGQVLRTSRGWKLLDFEGEPERPLEERRQLDSPVRDVAGMLRSFDYAARHQLVTDHAGDPQIAYRAQEWATRNRDAFRAGYHAASPSPLEPEVEDVLLRAYETDKAVYEAVYEARNRPRWLPVPMAALERLAAGAAQAPPPRPSPARGAAP